MTQDQLDGTRSASPSTVAEHWLRRVEFESLPRVVQDRFVASTAELFPPWPILRAHPRPPASRGWGAVGVVAAGALIALAVTGFGDPSSAFATRPAWGAAVFTAVLAGALLGLLRALAAHGAHDLPFRVGVYLFPSEVVDARSPTLRIHPLEEMSTIGTDGRNVRLTFRDGAEFLFRVPDREAGNAAVAQVLRARDALVMSHDAPELVGLVDPLWASVEATDLATSAPFHVRWSFWVERSLAVALAAACVLGPPLFVARDWASDELAFRRAAQDGSAVALAAYASHGKRHVREVRERLLPMTAVRALKTTAAIEQWMSAYPVAAATDEAKALRRASLLRDLSALGTLPAIRAFAETYRADGFAREIEAATLRAHQAMLARRIDSIANTHLLATPAACGTELVLTLERGASSLHAADRAVSSSPRFGGTVSFPSTHLASQPAAEALLRAALEKRVHDAFPEGCLRVATGTPEASDPASAKGRPSLALTWTPRYTGTLLESTVPPAVFADLAIVVEARLLGSDGRELARLHRTYDASVRSSVLACFAHLYLRDPADGSVERLGYEELVKRSLDQAARDVSGWLVGHEPALPVAPL